MDYLSNICVSLKHHAYPSGVILNVCIWRFLLLAYSGYLNLNAKKKLKFLILSSFFPEEKLQNLPVVDSPFTNIPDNDIVCSNLRKTKQHYGLGSTTNLFRTSHGLTCVL